MRAFIAIELPEDIRNILGNINNQLEQTGADVKWVLPQNAHLTLKFLGEITPSLVDRVSAALNETAQKNPCFTLRLSGLGAFPKLNYARVIWIGITNDQPVIKIAKELKRQMREIGFPKESRKFNSHITLGRVRSGSNQNALIEKIGFLNKESPHLLAEFKVINLTFFKSTLTPQGPIYEKLSSAPLSCA
ncbi:MAG: RNA 2',3'-cyclic phosphodiesterase [Candidatus Omnitrophota bacterium]